MLEERNLTQEVDMAPINILGDWSKTFSFLKRANNLDEIDEVLSQYAERGVYALMENTPKDSGETSHSWGYEIEKKPGKTIIYWTNSNINKGVNIAVILQYGHGTRNGGFVEGIDYINPALKPLFEELADSMFKELSN